MLIDLILGYLFYLFHLVAVLQFEQESYIFDETSGTVSVPVIRTGDLSYETSVICFTRQRRARVMMDYVERPWTDASRIPFLPGQKVFITYYDGQH